ncbi:unnamed protein product [Effrenium voratum]|nr:unnamed protein product [Effrenium voratum]
MADEPLELLRFECAVRGLPFAVLVDRHELATCLLAVALWDVLPKTELRRELRHWGLCPEADGGVGRSGLETQLVDALWTSLAEARFGVPVRSFSPWVGLALVGKAARLEAAAAESVEGEYRRTMRRLNLPAEKDLDKEQHMHSIILALVLEDASPEQLKQECKDSGISLATARGEQRRLLQRWLFVEALCRQRWEASQLPVGRLGYEARPDRHGPVGPRASAL